MRRVVVSVRARGLAQAADFELPTDVAAAELAAQLAQALGEPPGQAPFELRADSLARPLRPEETLAEAGLWDGARLSLARADDPFERSTTLAVLPEQSALAVPSPPSPPVLALPRENVRPRRLAWLLGLAVVAALAVAALAVYLARPRAAGPGTVAAQDPPAGTRLPPGSSVALLVASGNVTVPNVVGLPEQDAWSALREAGLDIETRHARRSDIGAGRAATVSPPPSAVLPAGSTVVLTISQGE